VKKEQNNYLVAKSNSLVEASYRLSVIEQQIILFAIHKTRENGKGLSPDSPLTITAKEFNLHFPTENAYKQLKKAMDTLFDRYVMIKTIDPETGNDEFVKERWITRQSYVEKAGKIRLTFNSFVIPYITRLQAEFTSFGLSHIAQMTSAHAIRIYELLAQYLSIGTREIEIESLKKMLQITDEYSRFSNLKARVIDVAVEQINKFSDLNVSYDQIKTGRAITHLQFFISKKPEYKKVIKKIDEAYIKKHARPGETYDQAMNRLRKVKS
jgi:plasmid replication initiation protein